MAKFNKFFEKMHIFLCNKLEIVLKGFYTKQICTLGADDVELEAFRAIPVIFGHPETINLGIQLQNSPFSYINGKTPKILPIFDGP